MIRHLSANDKFNTKDIVLSTEIILMSCNESIVGGD